MAASPIDPHSASPAELQERIRADGVGGPYLLFRDGEAECGSIGEAATITWGSG